MAAAAPEAGAEAAGAAVLASSLPQAESIREAALASANLNTVRFCTTMSPNKRETPARFVAGALVNTVPYSTQNPTGGERFGEGLARFRSGTEVSERIGCGFGGKGKKEPKSTMECSTQFALDT